MHTQKKKKQQENKNGEEARKKKAYGIDKHARTMQAFSYARYQISYAKQSKHIMKLIYRVYSAFVHRINCTSNFGRRGQAAAHT